MKDLRDYLAGVAEGRLAGSEVDRPLASCWDQFQGSGEGGMQAHKLHGRMEDVRWAPPILSFVVERHGGTVNGSTRGELQHWQVNLDEKTAQIVKSGHRQLKPMAKRISIQATAQEVVGLALAGAADDRIKWFEDGSVKIVASVVFPTRSGFRRTVEGRRKRLLEYVAEGLQPHGWKKTTGGTFIINEKRVASAATSNNK